MEGYEVKMGFAFFFFFWTNSTACGILGQGSNLCAPSNGRAESEPLDQGSPCFSFLGWQILQLICTLMVIIQLGRELDNLGAGRITVESIGFL